MCRLGTVMTKGMVTTGTVTKGAVTKGVVTKDMATKGMVTCRGRRSMCRLGMRRGVAAAAWPCQHGGTFKCMFKFVFVGLKFVRMVACLRVLFMF